MKPTYMRSPTGEVFRTSNPEYHKECENLGAGAKGFAARQDYARTELRKIIKAKQTIYTNLRHVSKSGMSRSISLFIVQKGQIRNIDCLAADAMGRNLAANGPGIAVGGCGMDMGFSLVYSLGRALWPKGTRRPHGTRNGVPDTDGGYALRHEWI